MNEKFFAIKLNDLDHGTVYLEIGNIESIASSSRFFTGIGERKTAVVNTNSGHSYEVLADVEDVYAAIAQVADVGDNVPEVGLEKVVPQTGMIESQAKDMVDEYQFNPVQQEIADIVAEYSTFGRYNNFADAIDCVWAIKLHVDDADEQDLTDICVEDGKMQVFVAGSDKPFDISYFSDMEQKRLLRSLKDMVRWERMFKWLNEGTGYAEYVAINNKACMESKYDSTAYPIYANKEENINAFGLDASKLAKAMASGSYRKDEEWITLECGELVSTDDPCSYIDCHLLTDWALGNSEVMKEFMPEVEYKKVFD